VKLSVIIPCSLGHRCYLNDCIRSVQFQNFDGYEIGIFTDTERKGTPAILNEGITAANGEYVTVVHGDDLIEPWHLSLLMEHAASDRFVYGDLRIFSHGHKGAVLEMPAWDFEKAKEKNLAHAAILFPRAAWKESGGYPEEMTEGREDWAMTLRLAANGCQGLHVEGPASYLYRKEGQGRSEYSHTPEAKARLFAQLQAVLPEVYGG
jgi:hypothetical protein